VPLVSLSSADLLPLTLSPFLLPAAENTRASYPIDYIDNAKIPCVGPHPRNVVLLCCDAFGVLPPVSKLSLEQVMYHFISGYTSKVGNCYNKCYMTI
jgi:ATP-dependent phosphoenolpyruvate carboxykinase